MLHDLVEDFHQLAEKLKVIDLLTSPWPAWRNRPAEPPTSPPNKHCRRELQEAGYLTFAAMKQGDFPQIREDAIKPEWLIKGGKFLRADAPFFETVVMPAMIPMPPGFSLTLLAAAACVEIARVLEARAATVPDPERRTAKVFGIGTGNGRPTRSDDAGVVMPTSHIYKCRACGWQTLLVPKSPAKCRGCKRTVAGFDVVR